MRRNPHLYEANARLFLRRLSEKYNRRLTLSGVPIAEWQRFAKKGFDLIWLMGVWQRSPGARKEALQNKGLQKQYGEALPDWAENDVSGSPYAIYSYRLDSSLGHTGELAELKAKLNRLGIRLLVDFVPNHLALDHSWTRSHPHRFVQGTKAAIRQHPDWFYTPDGKTYLAHGKDLYFPPWTDTVQVNFYSTNMRQALIGELLRIAEAADGVRCDMAMLALNSIFGEIWGKVVKDASPETEFWTEAIRQVKQKKPDFIFLAEAYWGLEHELIELGFDFAYDKLFYDKLRCSPPPDIRSHLRKESTYHSHMARFIENHDELRSVTALGRERSRAAAVAFSTIPGLRLFHDGQLEGKKIRLPVQLIREPDEAPDAEITGFYDRLMAACNAPAFHEGKWTLLETSSAWAGNESHHNLLAWLWQYDKQLKIVAVNYSPFPAQGRLKLPVALKGGEKAVFTDELNAGTYTSDTLEVNNLGLYVALEPWHSHILSTE